MFFLYWQRCVFVVQVLWSHWCQEGANQQTRPIIWLKKYFSKHFIQSGNPFFLSPHSFLVSVCLLFIPPLFVSPSRTKRCGSPSCTSCPSGSRRRWWRSPSLGRAATRTPALWTPWTWPRPKRRQRSTLSSRRAWVACGGETDSCLR